MLGTYFERERVVGKDCKSLQYGMICTVEMNGEKGWWVRIVNPASEHWYGLYDEADNFFLLFPCQDFDSQCENRPHSLLLHSLPFPGI